VRTYEGYYEEGRFYPIGQISSLPGRQRVLITILDESGQDDAVVRRLAAIDDFLAAIDASEEDVPEFERVKFNREVDL
jgi:DNA-binding transcriptional regulator WhiA